MSSFEDRFIADPSALSEIEIIENYADKNELPKRELTIEEINLLFKDEEKNPFEIPKDLLGYLDEVETERKKKREELRSTPTLMKETAKSQLHKKVYARVKIIKGEKQTQIGDNIMWNHIMDKASYPLGIVKSKRTSKNINKEYIMELV